jgi:hypothetical protein
MPVHMITKDIHYFYLEELAKPSNPQVNLLDYLQIMQMLGIIERDIILMIIKLKSLYQIYKKQ